MRRILHNGRRLAKPGQNKKLIAFKSLSAYEDAIFVLDKSALGFMQGL
jgi:hypothetical protein